MDKLGYLCGNLHCCGLFCYIRQQHSNGPSKDFWPICPTPDAEVRVQYQARKLWASNFLIQNLKKNKKVKIVLFVVNKISLVPAFLQVLRFSFSVTFHHLPKIIPLPPIICRMSREECARLRENVP